MNEWKIEYDNDTGPDDGGFWEWWSVTNGVKAFKCESEEDAQILLVLLQSQGEKKDG